MSIIYYIASYVYNLRFARSKRFKWYYKDFSLYYFFNQSIDHYNKSLLSTSKFHHSSCLPRHLAVIVHPRSRNHTCSVLTSIFGKPNSNVHGNTEPCRGLLAAFTHYLILQIQLTKKTTLRLFLIKSNFEAYRS